MTRTTGTIAAAIALAVLCGAAPGVHAADRPAARPAAAADARHDGADGELRLSKLIGMKVEDRTGDALGAVKDLVLDTTSGRVHYAVVSAGGVLGIGDKLFAVPLSQLHRAGNDRLRLDVDKERLQSQPMFESGRWPDWNDAAQRARVDQRYGASPAQINAHFRRASDLAKVNVRDADGGRIGNVKDMVVDLPASRVDYVVVEVDRAWTPNDKLVAVPMNALTDGATASPRATPDMAASSPPRNSVPPLAFTNPTGEPSKGTASAIDPPSGFDTRPTAVDPAPGARAQPIERPPLKTTTSYDDDESLVFKGKRQELVNAPAFDAARYPE
jgi:sporulation protein YlmC with PRC-barrel domain